MKTLVHKMVVSHVERNEGIQFLNVTPSDKPDFVYVETNSEYLTKQLQDHRIVSNLMSGKPVVQHKDTPLCCDVSSETYWSM